MSKTDKLKVVTISIDEIRPYWRNPRDNEAAVEAVKQSIQDYGFNSPLVLDSKNVIIAGHTRYKALQQLQIKQVPCVILDISDAKAKEYRIADNKTSELATWDIAKLIPELREIGDIASMEIYFPDQELSAMLQETAGVAFEMPSADQIAQVHSNLSTTFETRSTEAQSDYVLITCPHCGEESHVSRKDVLKQPAVVTS